MIKVRSGFPKESRVNKKMKRDGDSSFRAMRDSSSLLPGLPNELIMACYAGAPGNEIESGKFESPESSAALVANTFGYFLDKFTVLPPLSEVRCQWPATGLWLERTVRFPWCGGRHPCLDVLVETPDALIGIESKRFEPFRSKQRTPWSSAYRREVWGGQMSRFTSLRDSLENGQDFVHLDAVQLIKHAFGLRSEVARSGRFRGKRPFLIYLHAEPPVWPDGTPLEPSFHRRHRDEIARFSEHVAGDEVAFMSMTYRDLLSSWTLSSDTGVANHGPRIWNHFFPMSTELS
jgi:hypothetical protein